MAATILQPTEAQKLVGFELITNRKGLQAVHETVVALRANRRQGTRATKTKATVAGSGAKPWRQKGTGRARAGYKSSPIWTGGGVVFGPQPRDFSKKTPKNVRLLALRKAFSSRILAGDVILMDNIEVTEPKTKHVASLLKSEKLTDSSVLLMPLKASENLKLAARNIQKLLLVSADDVNAEHLLKCDKIITTAEAVKRLGQRAIPQPQMEAHNA